jgi:hypothetical protein
MAKRKLYPIVKYIPPNKAILDAFGGFAEVRNSPPEPPQKATERAQTARADPKPPDAPRQNDPPPQD